MDSPTQDPQGSTYLRFSEECETTHIFFLWQFVALHLGNHQLQHLHNNDDDDDDDDDGDDDHHHHHNDKKKKMMMIKKKNKNKKKKRKRKRILRI